MPSSLKNSKVKPAWVDELEMLDRHWRGGDELSLDIVCQELETWRRRLHRAASAAEEWLDIVDPSGTEVGYAAPRWFCHLTGLRHRVVHVFLLTPQNYLILQMRAHDKPEWPGRFDTTVGGHVRSGFDWLEGVYTEVEEEIGLPALCPDQWLLQGNLQTAGPTYERYGVDTGPLPMRNRQINQLFSGTITPWGLANAQFTDGEVAGIYFCSPDEVERMIQQNQRIAPGLRNAFPRWQAWRSSKS